MAKLTSRFRLQAYLGATIIDYINQAISILKPIGNWKESSLYHKYRPKIISTHKIHSNLVIVENNMKKYVLLLISISLHENFFFSVIILELQIC